MIELLPLFLFTMYIVPFMIAAGRDHDSTVPILLVNLFLGWTVIGWFAVLFWALLTPPRMEEQQRRQRSDLRRAAS